MNDLKALVAKWRELAGDEARTLGKHVLSEGEQNWHEARSQQAEECADELEAALSQPAGGEWVGQDRDVWAWLERHDMQHIPLSDARQMFDDARSAHMLDPAAAPAPPSGEDGWQPIETAPMDGREMILLLTPSGWPQVAWSNTWWTSGFSVECKPTHWHAIEQVSAIAASREQGEGS